MLSIELIQNAILKSRLNGRDPKVMAQAKLSLEDAIRKYSADGTVNGFQKVIARHINNGTTTIGRPIGKKGVTVHHCIRETELPNLTGYNPDTNNFGYIIGHDVFVVDNAWNLGQPELFEIRHELGNYSWEECGHDQWTDYLAVIPDIWVWDVDSIASILDDEGEWFSLCLRDFHIQGKPERTYVATISNDGIVTIYSSTESNVTIIYNAVFECNDRTKLNIPPMQQLLLQAYVAWDITRAPAELKLTLKEELENLESSSRSISMQNAPVLTWRG